MHVISGLLLDIISCVSQEQERRRKAELAAHSAMNGQRVKAFEFAGPDFEVGTLQTLQEMISFLRE